MTNYLANLLLCAFVLSTPLLAIWLAEKVEQKWDAWVDYYYWLKLSVEEWIREHV